MCSRNAFRCTVLCACLHVCLPEKENERVCETQKNLKKLLKKEPERGEEKKGLSEAGAGRVSLPVQTQWKASSPSSWQPDSWTIRGEQRPRDEEGISLKMRRGDSGAEHWGGGGLCD